MINDMNKDQLFSSINQHQKLQVIGPMPFDETELDGDCPTICVDGGARHAKNLDTERIYIIGDADSFPDSEQFHHLLKQDKDISDLGFILQNLAPEIQKLALFGFTGGRLDHQLFVLGELDQFSMRTGALLVMDSQFIFPKKVNDNFSFEGSYQGIFSVGTYRATPITLRGNIKYALEAQLMQPHSSQGLSNLASGSFQVFAPDNFWLYFDNKPSIKDFFKQER